MNRPRSFRFRLAAITVATSGFVLIAFGAVSGWILYRDRLRAIDAEFRDFGCRVAGRAGRNVNGSQIRLSLSDRIGEERAARRFICLIDRSGLILYRDANWPAAIRPERYLPGAQLMDPQPNVQDLRPRDEGRQPPVRPQYQPRYFLVREDGAHARVAAFGNTEVIVVIGADLRPMDADLRALGVSFAAALPGALVVIALGALLVSRKALAPIDALSARMENLSARGLDQRIEIERADSEFRRIIRAFNAMMERLERSFHQANRFTADASHELRTPLAVMQGTLERAVVSPSSGPEAQQAFSELLDEVVRQRRVLDGLLLLSRADAGQLPVRREDVAFSEMLESLLDDAELHAEPRGIAIRREIQSGIRLPADPVLLRRAVENLLSNAVKHNREGGWIECRLSRDEAQVELVVTNSGDPIPVAEREAVFQRFYRGGRATAQAPEGVGLGLALAREIVLAHGGTLTLEDWVANEPGTSFRLRLPVTIF